MWRVHCARFAPRSAAGKGVPGAAPAGSASAQLRQPHPAGVSWLLPAGFRQTRSWGVFFLPLEIDFFKNYFAIVCHRFPNTQRALHIDPVVGSSFFQSIPEDFLLRSSRHLEAKLLLTPAPGRGTAEPRAWTSPPCCWPREGTLGVTAVSGAVSLCPVFLSFYHKYEVLPSYFSASINKPSCFSLLCPVRGESAVIRFWPGGHTRSRRAE